MTTTAPTPANGARKKAGSWRASAKVVRGGVARRRAQTAVMILTVLTAVAASVLAAGLLVGSRGPFDRAFAAQSGAHLTAQFDGTLVSAADLAATGSVPGVAAAAGPFPITSARPSKIETPAGRPAAPEPPDGQLPLLTLVGRSAADAHGPVDDLVLTGGSWPTGPGEIVLGERVGLPPFLGTTLEFAELPGGPTLTVVGTARSMTDSASGWVTPDQLAALSEPSAAAGLRVPAAYQMLYRLDQAGTDGQVSAGRDAIAAALPGGSLTGSQSYLPVRASAISNTAVFIPFVAAFGVLGLVMSALTIAIVVSGAVGASTWRIGVLKALGFTPAQVVRAYVAQALLPATVGVALGLLLGNLAAVPVLAEQADAYDVGSLTIPVWVDAAVAGAALALVALAALLASARAGRLRVTDAIAVGRTPRAGRGQLAHRLAGRLPLSRPLGLGLANPFAHPARSSVLAAAVGIGVVGMTFAVGLGATLRAIQTESGRDGSGAVQVEVLGRSQAGPPPGSALGPSGQLSPPPDPAPDPDPDAVAAAIAAQSGTRSSYSTGETRLVASGTAETTAVTVYEGDSSWADHPMISGTWFDAPGEAVVDSRFLKTANVEVGDSVTVTDSVTRTDAGHTDAGHTVTVRIVGEVFDLNDETIDMMTDTASLAGLGLAVAPQRFDVDLEPGTDAAAYVDALDTALAATGAQAQLKDNGPDEVIVIMETLIGMLTLMIAVVAVLGVLDTVVLDTRQRVHDFGVFKSLGMTPRQTVVMVITSVAGIGLVAGIVGVPVGIALHSYVVPKMGAAGNTGIPADYIDVYHLAELVPLLMGGLVIAVAGALLPAGWAAGTRTATALRTE